MSPETPFQKLRLLKLPEPIQFYLAHNKLTVGHARQLLRLKKIYCDLKTKFNASMGELTSAFCHNESNISQLFLQIRPEDNPLWWGGVDDKDIDLIAGAWGS